MIYTILSWFYITLLVYPIGLAFHKWLAKLCNDKNGPQVHFTITCISGLAVISIILSLICLVYPLNAISNILLLAFSVLLALLYRKELTRSISADIKRLRSAKSITYVLFFFYLIIIAYLSYVPSSHHDDGLYYSTSIKWLQEFGTVKGLANLNPRISFNSSWHILQANFGFSFFNAGLFNDLNGLLYLWILLYSIGGISDLLNGDISLANSLRALFLVPLLTFHLTAKSDYVFYNANQLSSSSPDIVVCMLLWFIFILFIKEHSVKNVSASFGNLLIIVYSIWLLTIKLSAVPVILIAIFYFIAWLMKQKWKPIIGITLFGLLFLAPWLIRNFLISGYLIFPFSAIDLFNVEWKLPIEHVQWHENAVRVYAISDQFNLNAPFDLPFAQWFPGWFNNKSFIQQVILIITGLITMVQLIICLIQLTRKNFSFFSKYSPIICLLCIFFTGIIFWLMNGPDFRMGYGFLWPYCILSIILFLKYFLEELFRYIIYPVIVYMFFVALFYYKGIWKESLKISFKPAVSLRMPEKFEIRQLGKGQVVHLVFNDDLWNCPLPVANNNEFATTKPKLIGETISMGFKSGQTKK